jgi:hypothetical protein
MGAVRHWLYTCLMTNDKRGGQEAKGRILSNTPPRRAIVHAVKYDTREKKKKKKKFSKIQKERSKLGTCPNRVPPFHAISFGLG